MLKNLQKHSVNIVFNTIYGTGELTGTDLDPPTMEAAPNIPLVQFCLNCIPRSSSQQTSDLKDPSPSDTEGEGSPCPYEDSSWKRNWKEKR